MNGRQATPGDMVAIKMALSALMLKSPAVKMQVADWETGISYITHVAMPRGQVWIVNGYMVMFDVGRDWYMKDEALIEQIIIRVYQTTHDVGTAVRWLEEFAAARGLRYVVSGDTQIGLMSPVYLAHGYKPMGTQFIKEVASGISPQAHRGAEPD